MKKVLFLFDKRTKKNFLKETLRDYEDLYAYLLIYGVEAYRAPLTFYNKTKKLFDKVYFLKSPHVWGFKKDFKPDLIFDKTPLSLEKKLMSLREILARDFCFVNDLDFSFLLSNKWKNYQYFQEFYPRTILIESSRDFFRINHLRTAEIILKPLSGSSGKGIKIQKKDTFRPITTPFIAQELISSFGEIPGLVIGPHDLRIMMKNQTPFYAYLRIPPKGKFLANLAEGGKLKVVPLEKIPSEVFSIVQQVSKKLQKYKHKFYSIDFILDNSGKPWIIEMNSRPGIILDKAEAPYRNYFYNNLIDFINNAN